MRWAILFLLLFWATRLPALDALPLHNDEGLHLTRAVEVWNGHPFWAISDGKIVNHWLIALFYPQHEPVFVSRFATVITALVGLAAGCALARRVAGSVGMVMAASLWLTSPYLFFYERLAFSDAQAGALAVVAVWLALRVGEHGNPRVAVYTGLALGTAMLFKFTAAPFALSIALLILLHGSSDLRQRLRLLAITAGAAAVCFVPPLVYLLLRGDNLFAIAFGWLGTSSGGTLALAANAERLWAQLTGFGSVMWVVFLIGGLVLLGWFAVRPGRHPAAAPLLLAGIVPLLVMMLLGREVLSRHFVVTLPLLLVLAGAGLALLLERERLASPLRGAVVAYPILVLMVSVGAFFVTAYVAPHDLPLPQDVRYEHITSHSSGYGLREALAALPQTRQDDLPVIGSMFPDSCRRANFYAVDGRMLRCTDAPGVPEIEAALREYGAAYVLVDNAPLIGVDVDSLGVQTERIAAYPRPGEDESTASVVLWRMEAAGR